MVSGIDTETAYDKKKGMLSPECAYLGKYTRSGSALQPARERIPADVLGIQPPV